ncbi:hypothetical protein MKW98_017359 [Papaver atlanticum]|uniref:FAS1 domain-containing protein n=1 Tax=Papaver atlanticum TaxID=357466 RepID=A0AAD4SS03_9MAGN|nr:hypothetical protein MKW98_017359 [Papaver atlanticum]
MAYFLLTLALLISLIQVAEPAVIQSELVTKAIRILSDSGYESMSLTLDLVSQTSTFPSSTSALTIFAPSDAAFVNSGQPSLNLFQYHISPLKYSIQTLKSLPYGTRIPTLFPNQSLLVSSFVNGGRISVNGVRINESAIIDYGSLSIFATDGFFDPFYQTTHGCRFYPDDDYSEFDTEIANASKFLLSRGYFIMSSTLDLQLRGLVKETTDLTIFAVTDSVLTPYFMNLSLGSVFHRHFLPCKLTENDLWGLEDGTMLRTLDKDFSIQIVTSLDEQRLIGEALSIGDDDRNIDYNEFWGVRD